jgi:hypothetical protein
MNEAACIDVKMQEEAQMLAAIADRDHCIGRHIRRGERPLPAALLEAGEQATRNHSYDHA